MCICFHFITCIAISHLIFTIYCIYTVYGENQVGYEIQTGDIVCMAVTLLETSRGVPISNFSIFRYPISIHCLKRSRYQ